MCNFLSGKFTRQGKLYTAPGVDSHTHITKLFNLHEGPLDQNAVSLEYIPKWPDSGEPDFGAFELRLDQEYRPEWFDVAMEEIARNEFVKVLRRMYVDEPRIVLECGDYILGPDANIENAGYALIRWAAKGATIQNAGYATIQNAWSATIQNAGYATIQNAGSATIQNAWSARIQNAWSATIQNAGSATIQNAWSATIQNAGYATIQNAGYATIQNAGYATIQNAWSARIQNAWSARIQNAGSARIVNPQNAKITK